MPPAAQSRGKTRSRTPAQPAAEAAPRRAVYLVLGMHRSGTSAVTQLLGLAGAQLPAHVMPGDEHNAKGYFEPWRIALFNDQRLRAAGGAWDDVFAFPFRPLEADADWQARAEALFAEEYRKVRFPLLKDPRVTVLLPLWRQVFAAVNLEPRCVVPVRHPLAVAGSLARRDGFPAEKSALLWTAYMLAAEAYTRDLPRAFVDYDALLGDWRGEVARIEAAHAAPLPKLTEASAQAIDRFLTPDLRHNQAGGELAALGWAGELTGRVFDWFQAAAAGQAPDRSVLEAAAAALAERGREVGPLVSPAARDLDVLRSELREARAKLDVEAAERRQEREHLEAELAVFYRAAAKAEADLADAILKS